MKGFLIAYAHGRAAEDAAAWDRRVEALRRGLPAARAAVSPGFACILFSAGPADAGANQALRGPDAQGRTFLACGPRVDLGAAPDPESYASGDPAALCGRGGLFTGGMETTVLIRHDPCEGLAVKTDLLNSAYVYRLALEGCLLLSNSALALAPHAAPGLDAGAMAEFLATGSIFGNKSLIPGVDTLMPSRFYAWDRSGKETSREYWRIADLPFESLSLRQGVGRILEAMDADFARLKASGRPMVFDLTGGFDSRCNAGLALRGGLPFRATVTGAPQDEDARLAARIAARFRFRLDRVDQPPVSLADRGLLLKAGECCDYEYDILEYARIYDIHARRFAPGESSVHGGCADVMRNYFLLRGFYAPDPGGALQVDNLIDKKFTPLARPADLFRDPAMADWRGRMRGNLAAYDEPGLPAFARLDNIYLRIRMQFWQGRIASSTTRIHPSFTPWVNVDALGAILATRWREKSGGMLSRALLAALPRGLNAIPLTGGGIPGTGPMALPKALPNLAAHYGGKVVGRLKRKAGLERPPADPLLEELRAAVGAGAERLEPHLDAGKLRRACETATAGTRQILCRAYTLLGLLDRRGREPGPAGTSLPAG